MLGYLSNPFSTVSLNDNIECSHEYGLPKDTVNVMVGHSANSSDGHIEIIDYLKKFRHEKVRFYFPISYGNEIQKSKIRSYATQQLGKDKVVFLDRFLPLLEYNAIIDSIDIGILAGKKSYALGNVSAYLNKGKTVYLRKNGALADAFRVKQIPCKYVEDISMMTWDEFSAPCVGAENRLREVTSFEESVGLWKRCLAELG